MAHYPRTDERTSSAPYLDRETPPLVFDDLFRPPVRQPPTTSSYPFPEKFVDELSRREVFNKHYFRPNTYLHKWWARRCGTTFRAILKQFVDDQTRHNYYTPGGLEGKVVLDPMMGGGTTLHEAIRLGAHVIGADIDPIPIVQARTTLTPAALTDLQTAFNQFFAHLYHNLGHYFQTECPTCQETVDTRYTLYGLRKACACSQVVQIEHYDLRHKGDERLRIWPESWEISEAQQKPTGPAKAIRLITKSDKTCPACGQVYREQLDMPYYARYVPIAIAGNCPQHKFFFRPPSDLDLARIEAATAQRQTLDWGSAAHFAVTDGPKSSTLLKHHINSYLDIFSSRQLLFLHQAIQSLQSYKGITKLNLGLLVSTALEFNSMLCGYKGWHKRRPGAIRHVFAMHAYAFPYTALENNPLNHRRASGNLQLLFRARIERARQWAMCPTERKLGPAGKSELVTIPGEKDSGIEVFDQTALMTQPQAFWLIQGDSRHLPIDNQSVDLIVTDPPYYDSVQYSDLATFFRVWLTHLLPNEVEWTYDGSHSAVAIKGHKRDRSFVTVLAGIFRECGRVLKRPTGQMVFTFHHWDPDAWAELTIALKGAGFHLVDAHVVFSEHPISVHIHNFKAIKHDSILIFTLDHPHQSLAWPPLDRIDTDDSETFCRQCNQALGWLLTSPYSEHDIRLRWKQLITGPT